MSDPLLIFQDGLRVQWRLPPKWIQTVVFKIFSTLIVVFPLVVSGAFSLRADQITTVASNDPPRDASEHRKAGDEKGWRDLFNGKDLSGWKANKLPESFTVHNGILKAHGMNGMSHLFVVDEAGNDIAFKNFELKALVRSEPNSNSGFFFHTDRELRKRQYLNKGYEVQLNSSQKEKRKTGSLYAIVDLDQSPVDETKWFEIHFRVTGKRIQVFVGGEQVVDYTEPANPTRPASRSKRLIAPNGGAIAIQAHDPKSIFYFQQIRIRELD